MQNSVQVSLLIGNELEREGLRRILASEQFEVDPPGAARAGNPSVETFAQPEATHLIVLEVSPEQDLEVRCRDLEHAHPGAKLVLLAEGFDVEEVELAFGCGIDGYIVKDIACEPLARSLRLVSMGEKVLPSRLAGCLAERPSTSRTEPWQAAAERLGLSQQEKKILGHLVTGSPNKSMARQMGITEATAKVHVKAVLRKLGVQNRTQAAVWAVKRGYSEAHLRQR